MNRYTIARHSLTSAVMLFLSLPLLLALAACSGSGAPYGYEFEEENPPVVPVLTVSPKTLENFKAAGETRTLSVNSNVEWEITDKTADASWLSVVKSGTTAVTVTVAANETTERRTAQFSVSTTGSDPIVCSYTVTQEGKELELTFTPQLLDIFEAEGGTQTLTVRGNVEWEITPATNDASWLTVVRDGSTIVVTVQANESTEQRDAHFTVTSVGDNPIVRSYTVTQKGKELPPTSLTLSADDVQLTVDGTAVDIQVTSNTTWQVLSGYESWLTVTTTATTITVSATPNDRYESRTTELTVQTDDEAVTRKVTVTQAPKPKVVPGEGDNDTPGYSRRSK